MAAQAETRRDRWHLVKHASKTWLGGPGFVTSAHVIAREWFATSLDTSPSRSATHQPSTLCAFLVFCFFSSAFPPLFALLLETPLISACFPLPGSKRSGNPLLPRRRGIAKPVWSVGDIELWAGLWVGQRSHSAVFLVTDRV